MKTSVIIIASIAILCVLLPNVQSECLLPSCFGRKHTLCELSWDSPSQKCRKLLVNSTINTGLSQEDRIRILNRHNYYRNRVAKGEELNGNPGPQPAATNMAVLEWDPELETLSQRWANQCNNAWRIDNCLRTQGAEFGQNVYEFRKTNNFSDWNIEDSVKTWYSGVQSFNPKDIIAFSDSIDDRAKTYTQLVWAQTNKVGCGSVRVDNKDTSIIYVVCSYRTAGNIIGEPVYLIA